MNQKLAEARILAARKMPYMTHQVMSLIPVEKPGLGTVCVDEYCRLYFDPAFLERHNLKDLGFIVLHEAVHVWSRHAKRGLRLLGERPAGDRLKTWRIAVDAAVNDVLVQSRLECPEEGITPGKLGLPQNKTAEEYFDLLLQRAKQEEEQSREPAQTENQSQEPTEPEVQGQSEGGAENPAEVGGSAADGQPRPWEDGPPSAEHPGLAEHEQNIIEAAVAKAIEQYQEQRGRGSVPGGLARQAGNLLHPRVDPARELLAKVKYAVGCTSGFGDFTYRKPNRRQPAGGALLPAHVKPIPRVTVIIDTSGSMEEADLALALGVIGNALRSLPDPRGLRVLAGDTAVVCAKNVFRPEQIELKGGGGTDMSALIVAAAEERPAPKAILVVTDGYTGWPREPVGPRVVACLTQASTADGVPEWIDTVVLNPGE
jgi:predicted metal-dependent peptidase